MLSYLKHNARPFAFGAIASGLLTCSVFGQDTVRQTQEKLSEWIDIEKQISADRSEWTAQKGILRNSISFMEGEIERLAEMIERSRETASAGERKRGELDARRESLDAVMDDMKQSIEVYEKRVGGLAKSWPEPFLKMVEAPLKKIPVEGQEMAREIPLTMRLQNIVVILSQFDKYQSIVTKDTGIQEVDGISREVTTLYFGFAYAYFVDSSGSYAGFGHPSTSGSGWAWVGDESIAPDVQNLVAVHDRAVDARFVGLPAKIVTP